MYKKRKIERRISEMRERLYKLIDEKNNLLNSKIIEASQELDKVLNEYNNILSSMDK